MKSDTLKIYTCVIFLSCSDLGICGVPDCDDNDPLCEEYYLKDPKETAESHLQQTVVILNDLKKIAEDGLGTAKDITNDIRDIKEKNHDLEIKVTQAASERSLLQREQIVIKERQAILKEKTDWVLRKMESQDKTNAFLSEGVQISLNAVKSINIWVNRFFGVICPVIAGLILLAIKQRRKKYTQQKSVLDN